MNKRRKISLILVAVLLLGTTTLLLFAGNTPEEETELETPGILANSVRLINRAEIDLDSFRLEGDGYSFVLRAERDILETVWVLEGREDWRLSPSVTRDMARNVFSLLAADTVTEDASDLDLSEFGIGRVIITAYFSDGLIHEIRLGNETPDRTTFYLMLDDDPSLYLINAINGRRLSNQIKDILDSALPMPDIMRMESALIAERGRTPMLMDVHASDRQTLEEMLESFGGTFLTMTSPVSGREVQLGNIQMRILDEFEFFRALEVVDIEPQDLARFGLEEPETEFALWDIDGNGFHIKFGNAAEDEPETVYFKYSDRPHVFLTERRFRELLRNLSPFQFVDRFVVLHNITNVERIIVEPSPGLNREGFVAVINNFEDDAGRDQIAPFIDGRAVDDREFRSFYQALIGVLFEQEIGLIENPGAPLMTITYNLLDGETSVVEFFEFDANFHAVREVGFPLQFITSRLAIERIFVSLEELF